MDTTLQEQELETRLANRLLENPDFIRRMAMAIEDLEEPELPASVVEEILQIEADIKAGREKTYTLSEIKAEIESEHLQSAMRR